MCLIMSKETISLLFFVFCFGSCFAISSLQPEFEYVKMLTDRAQKGLSETTRPEWFNQQNISSLSSAVSSFPDDTDRRPSLYIASQYVLVNFLAKNLQKPCSEEISVSLANALPSVADVTCDDGAGRCNGTSVMELKAQIILSLLNNTNLASCSLYDQPSCQCLLALSSAAALGKSSLLLNVPFLLHFVNDRVLPFASPSLLNAIWPAMPLDSGVLSFILQTVQKRIQMSVSSLDDFNWIISLVQSVAQFTAEKDKVMPLLNDIVKNNGCFAATKAVQNGSKILFNAAKSAQILLSDMKCNNTNFLIVYFLHSFSMAKIGNIHILTKQRRRKNSTKNHLQEKHDFSFPFPFSTMASFPLSFSAFSISFTFCSVSSKRFSTALFCSFIAEISLSLSSSLFFLSLSKDEICSISRFLSFSSSSTALFES